MFACVASRKRRIVFVVDGNAAYKIWYLSLLSEYLSEVQLGYAVLEDMFEMDRTVNTSTIGVNEDDRLFVE